MAEDGKHHRLTLDRKRFAMLKLLVDAPARPNPALGRLLAHKPTFVITTLSPGDDAAAFDSGVAALDRALRGDLAKAGQPRAFGCHVVKRDGRIAAFYRLRLSNLVCVRPDGRDDETIAPMPLVVLPRIAVDKTWQGMGLGALLLGDAIRRGLGDGAAHGAKALYIHALSAELGGFYRHYGLRPLPAMIDPQGFIATAADLARAD